MAVPGLLSVMYLLNDSSILSSSPFTSIGIIEKSYCMMKSSSIFYLSEAVNRRCDKKEKWPYDQWNLAGSMDQFRRLTASRRHREAPLQKRGLLKRAMEAILNLAYGFRDAISSGNMLQSMAPRPSSLSFLISLL